MEEPKAVGAAWEIAIEDDPAILLQTKIPRRESSFALLSTKRERPTRPTSTSGDSSCILV